LRSEYQLDELAKKLKAKKPRDEEPDPKKKEKIMDMHATGEEIGYIRCDYCSERFPASALLEYNKIYYCQDCYNKIQLGEIIIESEISEEDLEQSVEDSGQNKE